MPDVTISSARTLASPQASALERFGMPIISGLLGFGESLFASDTASAEAEKNRRWQEYMSGTAHQREVADLRKAGLNPILSVRHGGASTPPGSAASAFQSQGSQRFVESMRLRNDLALQTAQIRDINSSAALKMMQTEATREERENLKVQRSLMSSQLSHSGLDLKRALSEKEFYEGIGGKVAPWMRLLPNVNPLILRGTR